VRTKLTVGISEGDLDDPAPNARDVGPTEQEQNEEPPPRAKPVLSEPAQPPAKRGEAVVRRIAGEEVEVIARIPRLTRHARSSGGMRP